MHPRAAHSNQMEEKERALVSCLKDQQQRTTAKSIVRTKHRHRRRITEKTLAMATAARRRWAKEQIGRAGGTASKAKWSTSEARRRTQTKEPRRAPGNDDDGGAEEAGEGAEENPLPIPAALPRNGVRLRGAAVPCPKIRKRFLFYFDGRRAN